MSKVFDITLQITTDSEETTETIEERLTELLSEEIWEANFVFANQVDETDEDSDIRPG